MYTMLPTLAAVLLGAGAAHASEAAGYVHLPVNRGVMPAPMFGLDLAKRDNDWLDTSISNNRTFYALSFQLGTPPQDLSLLIDTGSSDIWVMDPSNPFCSERHPNGEGCAKSSFFDASKSSSYSRNQTSFSQRYADGTTAEGVWAQDTAGFGNYTLKDFNFAYAQQSNATQGTAGIGLSVGETPYILGKISEPYQNLPEQLKANGKISHVAYSLWLNAQSTKAGSVLFGGVDKSKFSGTLYRLPLVPVLADGTSEIMRFSVKLQGMSVISESGDEQQFVECDTSIVLDSGSSLSAMPSELIEPFMDAIGAQVYQQSMWIIECDALSKSKAEFGLQIGGLDIRVPFSELGFLYAEDRLGTSYCLPGFIPGDIAIMGDNILRKLYVVYDLENKEVGLATAKTGADAEAQEDIEVISSTIPGQKAPGYSDTSVGVDYDPEPITVLGSALESPQSSVSFTATSSLAPANNTLSDGKSANSGSFSGSGSSATIILGGTVSGANNGIQTGTGSPGSGGGTGAASNSAASTATGSSSSGSRKKKKNGAGTLTVSCAAVMGALLTALL